MILGLQLSKIMRQAAESIWFEIYRGSWIRVQKFRFFPRNFRQILISPWNFPDKFLRTLFLIVNSKISVYPVTLTQFCHLQLQLGKLFYSLQKSPLSNVGLLALHNNMKNNISRPPAQNMWDHDLQPPR